MRKDVALPIAVQNLRRIWEAKKIEMQFNQTGAAIELGWSQGAISHYLNNITEMGPAAIVKFANFLDVDPTEIDPSIVAKLPKVRKISYTKVSSDLTSTVKKSLYDRDDIEHIYVAIDTPLKIEGTDRVINVRAQNENMTPVLKLCKQSKYHANNLVAVRLRSEKNLRLYLKDEAPTPPNVHTLWAVMSIIIL